MADIMGALKVSVEIDRLRSELATKDARINELVNEVKIFGFSLSEFDQCHLESKAKDARIAEADKEIKKWQDEAIRQGYRQWLDDNEALRKELAEAKAKLEATTKAMDAAYEVGDSGVWRKDFYKEKARAEQTETALEAAIDDKREAIKTAENALAGLSSALEAANAEIIVRKTRISELAKQCVDLEDSLETANARIAELEHKLTDHTNLTNAMINTRDGAYDAAVARAERAEAHYTAASADLKEWKAATERVEAAHEQQVIVTANYAERAERAETECKAMRDWLLWVEHKGPMPSSDTRRIVRAALNYSSVDKAVDTKETKSYIIFKGD